MSKPTARDLFVVIGLWTFSRMMAFFLLVLIGALHVRMTFTGDVGMVMMWLSQGLPYDLFAALAAITLVWVIETKKALLWLAVLAALYLYGESMWVWRTLTHGWHEPPHTSDYIGILARAVIPTIVCFVAGTWWARRSAASADVAS
ncbi:MAG TPA: hypothetical protein VFA76_04535 [Terriglobales bacterium]|nr:hypothetical protein [Terriglobales bacterium]